ncbi:thioesterase family protein [Spirulina sp. 06S082]|uniref:acyl-CoA thioesterase n=1 Tax=Spirulina sp. 06S082 TaxID=3110248 RepID=UPI002B1FF750|nr:thioesterase family protein [Spirulina sp. 06S082]MEA5469152.1 thioesterase family protein [Spirulina sp. 06S082]
MNSYQRTIHLSDTDAAGVVYFANIFVLCHEAYEEALARSGINLKVLVSPLGIALPIVHSSADFLRPLFCGDRIEVQLTPKQLGETEFEITYQVLSLTTPQITLARGITRHVCINAVNRQRSPLPEEILQWVNGAE